jgi:hypothetical protein
LISVAVVSQVANGVTVVVHEQVVNPEAVAISDGHGNAHLPPHQQPPSWIHRRVDGTDEHSGIVGEQPPKIAFLGRAPRDRSKQTRI